MISDIQRQNRQKFKALSLGGLIGILGGLIGLGGAEFRLPVLIGVFKYHTLQAIVINLIVSLVTVIFSFIFRTGLVNLDKIGTHAGIIINILAGSIIGAAIGARFAARIHEKTLSRIIAGFLVFISLILISHSGIEGLGGQQVSTGIRITLGFGAGLVIGVISSMLGVAGGELIIPSIIYIYAIDIKLAGSLSLTISIPTILMGLIKYRGQGNLAKLLSEKSIIIWLSIGSILGALAGSALLRFVPGPILYYLLGGILLISAFKLLTYTWDDAAPGS